VSDQPESLPDIVRKNQLEDELDELRDHKEFLEIVSEESGAE
jgi:hypothetical protein